MIPPRFCHLACQPGRKQKGRVKPSPIPATSSQNNKKDKKKESVSTCTCRSLCVGAPSSRGGEGFYPPHWSQKQAEGLRSSLLASKPMGRVIPSPIHVENGRKGSIGVENTKSCQHKEKRKEKAGGPLHPLSSSMFALFVDHWGDGRKERNEGLARTCVGSQHNHMMSEFQQT